MRKASILLTIIFILTTLTGCFNSLKTDDTHAIVSLTTTDGSSYLWQSVNGAGKTISGQQMALKYKSEITLKDGDKAAIKFECKACGNVQELEIEQAWSDIISCDCPIDIDESGNSKEYTAIQISFAEVE